MANPKSQIRNPKCRPVIGLVGGIGSGKSTVAAQFARLGCAVVDADRMGHALLAEPAIRGALVARFGGKILGADGRIDRRLLGQEAFASPEHLEALNSVVHPALWPRVRRAILDARRRADVRAVVVDAALLLEKGLDTLCDRVVYLHAPKEVRRARIASSRGWRPSEVARREAMQISLKAKRQRADYTVDNRSSPEHTLEQVRTILSRLLKE